jgi:hypothetical protein
VSACKKVAEQEKRSLHIIRIGSSPEMDAIAAADPEIFASHGDLIEESAIPIFATCDLLYAMYLAGKKYELFRRTSLPIKVSTYAQAQRPIFAHTPRDSTLVCVVAKYKIGEVCESELEDEIAFVTSSNVPCHTTTSNAPEASLGARTRCNSLLPHFAAKTGKTFQNRIAVISVPPAGALPCYAEMVPLLAILQAFLEMR